MAYTPPLFSDDEEDSTQQGTVNQEEIETNADNIGSSEMDVWYIYPYQVHTCISF